MFAGNIYWEVPSRLNSIFSFYNIYTVLSTLTNKLNEFDYSWYDNWTQFSFSHGSTAPNGPGPPQNCRSFTTTLKHTTLGRTPLDEGSDRHRDLYLTINNTHKRQPSMHPVGKPEAAAPSLRPRAHWDRQLNTTSRMILRKTSAADYSNCRRWMSFAAKNRTYATCLHW